MTSGNAANAKATLRACLGQLYATMSPLRRSQFYLVMLLMFVGTFAELASIGAIFPFLSLLANEGQPQQPWMNEVFAALDVSTPYQRLLLASGLFMLLALVAGAVRLQLIWSSQKFVFFFGHDLLVEIQRRILLQPYSFHAATNTSSLVATLEKIQILVFNILMPLMQATIGCFTSFFIVLALIYLDPLTAISAAGAIGVIYLLISAASRKRLVKNSTDLARSYDERVKVVQESLGGIRDVIIDNSQAVYLDAFRRIDRRLNVARANTAFIGAAPRYAIEALGLVLIAALALIMTGRQGGFAGALPVLGALALGAQRLLPLLQQVYIGWSSATGHASVAEQVVELLRLPVDEEAAAARAVPPLPFHHRIKLEGVSFSYPNRRARALDSVTLEVPRGARVALIGKTGSGKSTFADLFMGLLEPNEGNILIDDVPLTAETRRRWFRSIAHVPQAIFLADTSIAGNIALGSDLEPLDELRVTNAAKKAQLHEFVESLPDRYETRVGERGVRLSGGQRQRLGIARAIYKNAPVLVLDEATSALDDETEAAVMQALYTLGEEGRTIIIIAHRLSTVSQSDIVARLENGRVVDLGSYADVVGALPNLGFCD